MMTGPASHHLHSGEVRAVDVADHFDHLAGGLLLRSVDDPIDFVGAGAGMAVGAIEAQVVGDQSHGQDEVVRGQCTERGGGDVLEELCGGDFP